MLAASLAPAQALELSVTDAGNRMARLGMIGKAEPIVHRGAAYLLVRLTVQDVRMVDLANGRTDWYRLKDRGLAYLPVKVACHAMTLEGGGQTQRAHDLSPCGEETTVASPFQFPLFVVFRYPKPGAYKVRIPVTVLPPAAPVATRRTGPAPDALPDSVQALLGTRELELSVLVPEPSAKPRY